MWWSAKSAAARDKSSWPYFQQLTASHPSNVLPSPRASNDITLDKRNSVLCQTVCDDKCMARATASPTGQPVQEPLKQTEHMNVSTSVSAIDRLMGGLLHLRCRRAHWCTCHCMSSDSSVSMRACLTTSHILCIATQPVQIPCPSQHLFSLKYPLKESAIYGPRASASNQRGAVIEEERVRLKASIDEASLFEQVSCMTIMENIATLATLFFQVLVKVPERAQEVL